MSKISTLKKATSISSLSKSRKGHSAEEHEPSQNVITAVLNYSKALSVRPSKNINYMELILN